jgi:hypothetical protein
MASHIEAWKAQNGQQGFMNAQYPSGDMAWGTAALKNATSWVHMDDDGFATSVTVVAGSKYWVLMRQHRDLPAGDINGDMGSIKAFGNGWEPHGSCNDIYEQEGILLQPGSIL